MTWDTLYVIAGQGMSSETLLLRAEAVFFILRELRGRWRFAAILGYLPDSVLDLGYNLIARNRYRIFGRFDACPMPQPEDRDKFIDIEEVSSRVS